MNPLCDLDFSNLVIAVDFNCGDVDWNSSTVTPDAYDRAPNQKLLDLANNCSLTNVQQQATRRGRALVEPNNFNLYLSKKTTKFLYQNWMIPLPLLLVTWKLQLRVEKQLSTLNINKASGPDQIPNIFLKQSAKESASVPAALFTQSLQTGNLPGDWLSANVSPIFKKGDMGLASYYRPVSFTCVCCKLMEHILVRHMLMHFDDENIISDKQHGFRKGHSCETQLITTVNNLLASAMWGTVWI